VAKVALVLFAGPETPCKLQHAFLFARDIVSRGGDAQIIFEGNSPKWLPELAKPEQKLHGMFLQVRDAGQVAGVCRGCALMHGVVAVAEELGLVLLSDAYGHVSLVPYCDDGYALMSL